MGSKSKVKKAIYVPQVGDYLTDGERLVEVVGKERDGIRVLDVRAASWISPLDMDECDPRLITVLSVRVAVEDWRVVTASEEEQRVA